jgi:hypothetical protein
MSKERMHIDIETDYVDAEVLRIVELGATRWDHQKARGFLQDPQGSKFCVLLDWI